MEKEPNGLRTVGEELASKRYTERFSMPIRYTIVVTRYTIEPDGKRRIVWDENLTPPQVSE